jgi:hypothetical protein
LAPGRGSPVSASLTIPAIFPVTAAFAFGLKANKVNINSKTPIVHLGNNFLFLTVPFIKTSFLMDLQNNKLKNLPEA